MRWRQTRRMRDKQASDQEAIAAKEVAHRAQYARQLAHKRSLGRLRLRAAGPRAPQLQRDERPALAVVVKGLICLWI